MKGPLATAIALSLVIPATAQGAGRSNPLILESRSNWVVDYGAERCTLMRAFGPTEEALGLRIASFGSRVGYRAFVVGTEIPRAYGPSIDFSHRLTTDSENRGSRAFSGTVGGVPAISFSARFGPYQSEEELARLTSADRHDFMAAPEVYFPDFEKTVGSIELRFAIGKTIRLETGNMAKPLEALRTCVDHLRQSWGLDPAVENRLSRRATPQVSTIDSMQQQYPPQMLRAGLNAYVPVRVMVDAEGKATACKVQLDAVDQSFRDIVCAGLATRFEPALDESGAPVASVYQTAVIFDIAR